MTNVTSSMLAPWPLSLPTISVDSLGSFLVLFMGDLTTHRSVTVFPWVHHLTIVWLIYLISSLNCFLASGLLTFCSNFQEVTAHQSPCLTQVRAIVGLGCQFSNLKNEKRKHGKPDLTVPWWMTAQPSIKWHSGIKLCISEIPSGEVVKWPFFYFQVHTGNIRNQNVSLLKYFFYWILSSFSKIEV